MRIGILTYHWVYNFGANLQTLSTIGYMRNHGYDPIVINWIPNDLEDQYNKSTIPEQIEKFKIFQSEFYPSTRVCRDAKDVADVIKEYNIDAVFIGADTLFTLRKPWFSLRTFSKHFPTSPSIFPNPYWGEFLNYVDVPTAGYSIASLDTKYKSFSSQKNEIKKYLSRFKIISTRDLRTKELVEYFSDGTIKPQVTPDSVFSFNTNIDFSAIESSVLEKHGLKEKYMLLCIPDHYAPNYQEWSLHLNALVTKAGYKLYELPRQTGKQCFQIPQLSHKFLNPIEWYIIIKNSSYYIGALMHPIITCIHNEVPFFSLDFYGVRIIPRLVYDYKTSKTYQILKSCGLDEYYVNQASSISKKPSAESVMNYFYDYDRDLLHRVSENKLSESKMTLNEVMCKLQNS